MRNNKQSSSVDWLLHELLKNGYLKRLPVIEFQQAKAMHKQEIEFSFKAGMNLVEGHLWKPIDKFEEFYKETFETL